MMKILMLFFMMLLVGCSTSYPTCSVRKNATGGLTESCGIYGNTYYRKDAMGNYSRSIPAPYTNDNPWKGVDPGNVNTRKFGK